MSKFLFMISINAIITKEPNSIDNLQKNNYFFFFLILGQIEDLLILLKSTEKDKQNEIALFVNSHDDYFLTEITYELFQIIDALIEKFSHNPFSKTFSLFLKRTINSLVEPKRISNLKRPCQRYLQKGGVKIDIFLTRPESNAADCNKVKSDNWISVSNGTLIIAPNNFQLLNSHVLKLCDGEDYTWSMISEFLSSYTKQIVTCVQVKTFFTKSKTLLDNLRKKKEIQ